jgi:hypothetical protein
MFIRRSAYERLVSEAALAVHVPKLALRAESAESTLARERKIHQQEIRHWASMFLRREKTWPLPPTADEKVEAQVERQQRQSQPPTLNADQLARREAVRQWAKQNGFSGEDADKSFMAQLSTQIDE